MPLGSREDCGTNHDGTSSEEYCHYCFQDGAFTSECTMEQMIEHCARFVEEFNKENGSSYTKEEAIAQMTLFFPTLKRWKNNRTSFRSIPYSQGRACPFLLCSLAAFSLRYGMSWNV